MSTYYVKGTMSGDANAVALPYDATLGPTINPCKLDPSNDEVALGGTAAITGGLTAVFIGSVGTGFDAQVVKASPGRVYGWRITNGDTAKLAFIKFYNKTTAPDPSADAAIHLFEVYMGFAPAAGVLAASEVTLAQGISFSTGIALCITQNTGTGETAVDSGDVAITLFYK